VEGGVRINYAQLLAAAHNMVAGVDVWLHAQQQMGIQTDIPAGAAAVCDAIWRKYDEVGLFQPWPIIATALFACQRNGV
jgi:hypothetical protein